MSYFGVTTWTGVSVTRRRATLISPCATATYSGGAGMTPRRLADAVSTLNQNIFDVKSDLDTAASSNKLASLSARR